MNRRTFAALALLIVLTEVSCVHLGYTVQDSKEAQHQIEVFHNRLASGDFDAIYADADVGLKSTASREAVITSMRQTKEQWGKAQHVTYSYVKVFTDRTPVEIRAVYNTKFENGDATEMFTFVRRRGKVKLISFNIAPGSVRPSVQ